MIWYMIGLILFLGLFSGFFFLWKLPLIPLTANSERVPPLSIIIPARNEELSLPALLKSIQQQSIEPLEVIIVDDESTDNTALIAEEFGATVLSASSANLPQKGKSAACWMGAQKAKGDWLVFLDSDTRFVHRDALRSIADVYLKKDQNGLFSIQPFHETEKAYETISVVLNIMVMAGLNRFSLLKDKLPHRGAFGPFLLTTRLQYEKSGGHQAILDSHMDDIELARLYKSKNWPVSVYGGKGSIHFRMFPEGISQLVNGWTKSLLQGAEGTHPLVHLSIGMWITGVIMISILVILSVVYYSSLLAVLLSLCAYLLYCFQFRWLMNKVGRFPLWTMVFPFFFVIAFIGLYIWAFVQVHIIKKVKWRGRDIKT